MKNNYSNENFETNKKSLEFCLIEKINRLKRKIFCNEGARLFLALTVISKCNSNNELMYVAKKMRILK